MQRVTNILSKLTCAFYFNVGVVLFTVLVILYMYFLSMSVVHVVLRKEVIQKFGTVESEIAQLESTYILAQHKVSNKIAALENFTENDTKIFVSRTESTLVFSNTSR
jgi:flagellin-specific chaperone FliS